MGKMSRQRRTGASEEKRRDRGFKAWKERAKESITSALDGQKAMLTAQAAAKMRSDPKILARWREYTGAEDDASIDYAHPCVRIEWTCCDVTLLQLAVEEPQEFLAETGCDREAFMAHYDQSADEP